MCGILVTHSVNKPFSHRSLDSLRKRGPDQIGFWADSYVQIAHSRLAIIGLDERGSEPLENDRHVLAFNGEIYNFNEIRTRLQSRGIQIQGGLEGARAVRSVEPSVPIVWGGVHPSLCPDSTLKDELCDMVVCGEGEIGLIELAPAATGVTAA